MDKYLLVSSPMRTGSTLLYNFFRTFPGDYIVKKYHISPMNPQSYDYFVTLRRHPAACISSYLHMMNHEYTEKNIRESFDKTKEEFDWIEELDQSGRSFPIRYEDFYNNHFYIRDFADKHFQIYVNDNQVYDFSSEYSWYNVMLKSKKEGEHMFQKNHISKHLGRNELHIEQLRNTGIMYKELKELSERFGYEY